MDCRNFEELSQLYIDAVLDDERIAQFEAHLLACSRLQAGDGISTSDSPRHRKLPTT